MKFILNKKISDAYPNLQIGIIRCHGINNQEDDASRPEINRLLREAINGVEDKFSEISDLANYPLFRTWRDTYKSFGEKHLRCSVEALIRRVLNGKPVSHINPLVDIYNYISMAYEIPVGGEDLAKIKDDIELTYATGDETFIELGSTEVEHPKPGEIVYRSGDTVLCRSFNYRECDLTKLTNDTTDCVLVIESMLEDDPNLTAALNKLKGLVEKYLGGTLDIEVLSAKQLSIDL